MDYIKIISNLNNEHYEKFGVTELNFSYSTDGYTSIIMFIDTILWHSATDERKWIEEMNDYEPFEPFIKRIFNEYVDRLHLLKF